MTRMRFNRYTEDEIASATSNFADEIGEGGFGTVYSGRGLRKHDAVAVKVFERNGTDEAWRAKMRTVRREMALARAVKHPNVMGIVGTMKTSTTFSIVYSTLASCTLADMIEDKTFMPTVDRLHIALCVARGIQALHNMNFVHADIKSQNVLMTGPAQAVIGDFGSSEYVPAGSETLHGQCTVGYPYWPPEYVDHGILSKAMDVYGFGLMMLELVVWRTTFEDYIATRSLLDSIKLGSARCFEGFEASCIDIMTRALRPDRRERPSISECVCGMEYESASMEYSISTPIPPAKKLRVS